MSRRTGVGVSNKIYRQINWSDSIFQIGDQFRFKIVSREKLIKQGIS